MARPERGSQFWRIHFREAFPSPGQVHSALRGTEQAFRQFSNVFRDRKGRLIGNGTFVFSSPSKGTLLGSEVDEVRRLLGYLFLACHSRNRYCAVRREYVNSKAFALYHCALGGPIGVEVRRRDRVIVQVDSPGDSRFYMPPQCEWLPQSLKVPKSLY